MPGMNPVLTRALYAEQNHVDEKVEYFDTEHLIKTTFGKEDNKDDYVNDD